MKKFILPFLFSSLFGVEIVVDTTNNYSILTITNDKSFICKQKNKKIYICRFNSLPSTPVFSTNTIDFKLTPFFDKNKFYLKIKVNNKSFIKSFNKNLYEGYNKRLKILSFAKKWVIISYKNKIPFLTNKPLKGLKFPLKIKNDFYLKAIDANGNPISYDSQTGDVIDYFTILRLENKQTLSMDRIEEFIKNYPNSIFLSDILYIKLKLLDEMGNTDKVIKNGKEWIKKYSSNEHLPEVLLILAKNYANQGMMENATYIYERLFSEYQNSKYAYEGMVYLADELYSAGDSKRAFELYKQAFSNTKDIEVASLAASRIAQRYLDEGNVKESIKYYKKLLKANKSYLLKNINDAYKLANQLSKNNAYQLAIQIGKEILKKINKDNELYENLIYNLASWNYESHNFLGAKKFIDLYSNNFPYGDYIEKIDDLKDKILFEIKDKNTTLMLERYNNIIEKYPDSTLSNKAFLKKINLLYKLKRYNQILKLSKQISDINNSLLINSAKAFTIKNLKYKNCKIAINTYNEFNITLNKKYDDSLFYCAYNVRKFNLASQICNKYLLNNNEKTALKWLKNKAKVFEIENNYKKLALIIDDICSIQKSNCYIWKYKQFFAYYNLNNENEFLKIASKLMNKDNIKNIDIFMKIVLYGKKNNNNLLVYTYSKKILELEKKFHTFVQSPFIDFTFVQVAKKLNKKNEAIKTLKNLINLNSIDEENKARAYYMLSSLTTNKTYLKKCIELKKSKIWMPLCKDSLELF